MLKKRDPCGPDKQSTVKLWYVCESKMCLHYISRMSAYTKLDLRTASPSPSTLHHMAQCPSKRETRRDFHTRLSASMRVMERGGSGGGGVVDTGWTEREPASGHEDTPARL